MTKIDSLLSELRSNGYAYAADFIEALQSEKQDGQKTAKTWAARYQEVLGQQANLQEQIAVLKRQNAEARAAVNALISTNPYEPTNARHALGDPATVLYDLRRLIADESYAASFQDIALYRDALLRFIPDPE